jgi:hypothetical protein
MSAFVMLFKMPSNTDEWQTIAEEFEKKWNFPHCIGAMDGKHIAINPPPNTGSLYFNYKHFFSIVLMAVVDANYKFLYVDIGQYGRLSDGGVYNKCSLSSLLADNRLHVPPATAIKNTETVLPYVLVADDAFALKPYVMKPYAFRKCTNQQRIYNYRLSRARRVVESAFGILSQRFLVFKKNISLHPDKVQTVVMAACCLHNFLMRNADCAREYSDSIVSGNQTVESGFESVGTQRANRPTDNAMNIRDKFCEYFNSRAGSVPWQLSSC